MGEEIGLFSKIYYFRVVKCVLWPYANEPPARATAITPNTTVVLRKALVTLILLFLAICVAEGSFRRNTPGTAPRHAWSDSAVADTLLPAPIDTAARPDTLARRPVRSTRIDTLSADTARKRSAALDAPVDYTAQDSLVYDAETHRVFLYGQGQVKYENMQLTAGEISMNMDSSLVHARAVPDTAGALEQLPLYKQGSDEYESEQMSYNFKSKRGFIQNVNTAQGNGYLKSQSSKRADDGTLYLEHATYTTCDAKHPHFYLKLSRGKVIPGKETVFGPAYLVVEDVPLPIGIPYGFFPFNKKYSSGIIMPSYGDETNRGFYLREGGYYFAINDYIDLKLLGEIYTKGSWGLSLETNYKKRYKYSGNFYISYLNTITGEKNMPDYSKSTSLKVQWSHTMTKVGSGNTTFSARVNFASQNYERSNLTSMYDPVALTQSTRASSISFSHTFTGIGLTLSGSANLTQNMRDSTLAVQLPELSLSLNRIYPFRRKHPKGRERWYEKISFHYTGQIANRITTKEDKLFHSNLIKDWKNGMMHTIPINATFQLFKYINVSPNFTFRDIMYTHRINRSWDAESLRELADTTYGFYNLYNWNVGVTANTTLYGFYKPWKKLFGEKIISIRHVFKPSITYTYAPDFTSGSYGYVKTYDRIDEYGNVTPVTYSPYQDGIFGYPSSRKQNLITMSISNNLEMKVKSDKDSTGEKKISLIDELSATLSYNFAAKTRPWSDLSTRLRLRLTKNYTFSMAAVFATYAYQFDQHGNVVVGDRTEWSYGRFGRFQGMSQSFHYTFNNQTLSKLRDLFKGRSSRNDKEVDEDEEDLDIDEANIDPDLLAARKKKKEKVKASVDKDGYLSFSIPWSLTLTYSVTMHEDRTKPINPKRMRYPFGFTHTLNATGNIRIAQGWNINFNTGYDFKNHKISMTTAGLSRDLHCFTMSCSVVLRPHSSFNFTFRARASELADALKWDKRSSYSTNIEWY